jgi:hypothetical protein
VIALKLCQFSDLTEGLFLIHRQTGEPDDVVLRKKRCAADQVIPDRFPTFIELAPDFNRQNSPFPL